VQCGVTAVTIAPEAIVIQQLDVVAPWVVREIAVIMVWALTVGVNQNK
jgi:hypothetical protein